MPRTTSLTTTERGYGADHQTERRRWEPIVRAGRASCWRCGRRIHPAAPWDLGHDDHDRTRYRGPEHRRCNRSAGARKGNRLRSRAYRLGGVTTSTSTSRLRW